LRCLKTDSMVKRNAFFWLVLITLLLLTGCGGKIRYTQSAPEAKDFHPQRLAVLYVNADAFPEAEGKGEQIITDVLVRKGWFKSVEKPETIRGQWAKNPDLKKTVDDYLNKLKTVNFSDPDLSKKIGEAYNIQAFIIGRIDLWNYSVEGEQKFAKVGMDMRLINATTGKVLWRANHNRIEDYWRFKPELSNMAKSLVKDIVRYMPR
jgi:hypothetical protein